MIRAPQRWSVLQALGLLLLLLLSSGCKPVESVALTPVNCMLVKVEGSDGRALFPIAQMVSEKRQYKSDLTHPGMRRYFVAIEGVTVGEISLGIGLGALGANLVSWVFDDEYTELVDAEFKLFIEEFERHGHELTSCEEAGYQGPVRIVPVDNITSEVESDRTDGGGAADSS
jgi:hypothetical protein